MSEALDAALSARRAARNPSSCNPDTEFGLGWKAAASLLAAKPSTAKPTLGVVTFSRGHLGLGFTIKSEQEIRERIAVIDNAVRLGWVDKVNANFALTELHWMIGEEFVFGEVVHAEGSGA
jgi:hypothetical protein